MKHLFLPYELAMIAKQKGFTENCFGLYITDNYGGTEEKPIIISVGGHWGSGINNSMINCVDFKIKPSECPAPTHQQIVDWFREKHNIEIITEKNYKTNKFIAFVFDENSATDWGEHDTFYQALNKALLEELQQL